MMRQKINRSQVQSTDSGFRSRGRFVLLCLPLLVSAGTISATVDPSWPREYVNDGATILLYQPQVDSWEDYETLVMRAAVAVTPKGASEAVFGALYVNSHTKTDMDARTILLKDINVTSLRFLNVENSEAEVLAKLIMASLPDSEVVALDRILAYSDELEQEARTTEVADS